MQTRNTSIIFLGNLKKIIRFIRNILMHYIYIPIRRPWRFLSWVSSSLFRFTIPISKRERRLLIIHDLSSQPFNIGDILFIQVASLILREKHNLNLIDFAIVDDFKNPAKSSKVFDNINKDNVMYHLSSILSVVQINPYLGSLFSFNSHEQLYRFIADNLEYYEVWPSAWEHSTKDYLFYLIFNKLIFEHFSEHGSVPHLTCRQFLIDDTKNFYYKNVWPNIPVTIQIRNNPTIGTHRNTHIESWLDFFLYCDKRFPVKFIITCSRSEIDDRMRQCPNVLIAKDFHTTIEQDLTLISEAAFHMGASSGPGAIATFNDKPYCIVNTDIDPNAYRGVIKENGFLRLYFSTPQQRFTVGQETTELLIDEFSRMWATINIEEWWTTNKMADNGEQKPLTWLR